MKILCVFGKHNYGDPERGLGYEYVNFIPALENLDHEVTFFESWDKSCYEDFSDLNRRLLHVVDQEKPDIIFFVLMTYEIWLETLQMIREGSDAALLNWATDDSWKYQQFSRFMAPAFDLYVTTYPSAINSAKNDKLNNFVLSQWAADSSRLGAPKAADNCRYEVSFVGSIYGNRKQWIEDLGQRGIHVETFGYGWPNGPIAAEDISHIMRESQISLNFADSGLVMLDGKLEHNPQIKARVFEVPGSGGMLVTESAEGLEEFFKPGEEIIVFDGIDDLVDKITFLLSSPDKRNAIAIAGYQRVKADHSYEMRFGPLIEQLLKFRGKRKVGREKIDFDQFEVVAKTHKQNFLLLLLKYTLLLPSVLIFGSQRGPRAARRFLFEFSWRYLGRRTYSATSWVGRIFYKYS